MSKRFKKIYIEISNVCNLQCTFCPEVVRGKKFMEPTLFKKVATEAAPLTEAVCFHLMGEPLLHPELENYLEICDGLKLPVELTTNAILLDDKRTEMLLKPIVRQVNFSLQSFESNFPDRDNESYLEKIFNFTRRALQERPDLYIYYRLWNEGSPGAQQSNQKIIEKIKRALAIDFKYVGHEDPRKNIPIKGRVSLHKDIRFEWPHPNNPIRSDKGFCYGISSQLGILADGTVVPCCLDKEGVINLGNCGSKRIDHVIRSPRAKAMRAGFKQGILVEDLCQKCTYIDRFSSQMERIEKQKSRLAKLSTK